MAWRIEFTRNADKAMRKLDKGVAARMFDELDEIAKLEDPRIRGKALTGNLAGVWRYRVGDYRMLYENLVAEAEENGLGGEFVDWGISISKWRADPVAIALYGWLLENEPEGMAAKSERQIDWEMGIVGMASSRRREEAVKSWRRSHGAAERENGGFFVTLGLSNAERSAANEAMIAEIPEVAFF